MRTLRLREVSALTQGHTAKKPGQLPSEGRWVGLRWGLGCGRRQEPDLVAQKPCPRQAQAWPRRLASQCSQLIGDQFDPLRMFFKSPARLPARHHGDSSGWLRPAALCGHAWRPPGAGLAQRPFLRAPVEAKGGGHEKGACVPGGPQARVSPLARALLSRGSSAHPGPRPWNPDRPAQPRGWVHPGV